MAAAGVRALAVARAGRVAAGPGGPGGAGLRRGVAVGPRGPRAGGGPPEAFEDARGELATEKVWPATGRQRRAARQVQEALGAALRREPGGLLHELGVTFTDVRMAPDLRKAFVRWTAFAGQEAAAERGLRRAAGGMRRAINRIARFKYTPELHFRREAGAASEERRRLEEAFARLDLERAREREVGGDNAGEGPG